MTNVMIVFENGDYTANIHAESPWNHIILWPVLCCCLKVFWIVFYPLFLVVLWAWSKTG